MAFCDQADVDNLYSRLTADDGVLGVCGWLKDRFGVSWQIISTILPTRLSDPDATRAQRATRAILDTTKIVIVALQRAADNRA